MTTLAILVTAALGALLCLVWLLTRNPSRDRQFREALATVRRQDGLIASLQAEALRSADVDPVAQVFADLIDQSGTLPAQLRRTK